MYGRCGGRPRKQVDEAAKELPDSVNRVLRTGEHQGLPKLGHKLKAAQFIEEKLKEVGFLRDEEGSQKPTEDQWASIRPIFGKGWRRADGVVFSFSLVFP